MSVASCRTFSSTWGSTSPSGVSALFAKTVGNSRPTSMTSRVSRKPDEGTPERLTTVSPRDEQALGNGEKQRQLHLVEPVQRGEGHLQDVGDAARSPRCSSALEEVTRISSAGDGMSWRNRRLPTASPCSITAFALTSSATERAWAKSSRDSLTLAEAAGMLPCSP